MIINLLKIYPIGMAMLKNLRYASCPIPVVTNVLFQASAELRAIKDDGKRKKIQEKLDQLTSSGYKVKAS